MRAAPGVVAVVTAADIPGVNDVGPIQHDDPIFADATVEFAGQPVFAVAATDVRAARARGEARASSTSSRCRAILTIDEALAAESYVLPPVHVCARRRRRRACRARRIGCAARVRSGGQDHFYLEGQIALAVPREQRRHAHLHVDAASRRSAAHGRRTRSGVAAHDVVVECRRMGGGFGGKETQMSPVRVHRRDPRAARPAAR